MRMTLHISASLHSQLHNSAVRGNFNSKGRTKDYQPPNPSQ
jgi:hypothetical protein